MDAKRIRILYLAHYFPPLGGVAALRSLKMVKYLADENIDCIVLCANPRGLREARDGSLISEIPGATIIHRYWAPDISWLYKILWGFKFHKVVDWISQNLLSPDGMRLALPFARRSLNKIMHKGPKPSLAIISGGPFSLMGLGPWMKEQYQIPYICDWRDEWTNNAQRINRGYPPRILIKELKQEARVLARSIANVFLTQMMRESFLKSHPEISSKPFRIIPNGYDDADFTSYHANLHQSSCLSIVYTGSFYDRIQPDRLWRAIIELVQTQQIDPVQLKISIIGRNSPDFVLGTYADNEIVRSIVRFEGFKTHQDCIRDMQSADLLLIFIPGGANSESILTGKLFDYLRSGKPILTIAPPDGLAARIVSEAGCGIVADFDDIDSIKTQLGRVFSDWKQGLLANIQTDQSYICQFSRKQQAKTLSELIRESLYA